MRPGQVMGGIAALAVAGGGVWAWRALIPHEAATQVPTATPTRGEFVVSLKADGTLQSDDAVMVRNGEARGKLTFIVADGVTVKAGDVFCRIESREMEQSEAQAELAYKQAMEEIAKSREAAQEEYENAKRAVERAERGLQLYEESNRVRIQQKEDQLAFDRADEERLRVEYERMKLMADKGYIAGTEVEIAKAAYDAQRFGVERSAKDLDLQRREIASELRQKKTAVESAQRKAEVAQGRIEERVTHAEERAEQAGKALEKVRASLADTTVRAPASGIVTISTHWTGGGERRPFEAGDQVYQGMGLGTISGTENMSVTCRIREMNVASVWKGQRAEIEFEALPGRTFSGTVSTVSAVAREVGTWEDPKAEPGVRVFDVWVKANQDTPGRLKPGLNGEVAFIVKRIPNALYVPLEAVFERAGKSLAYVKRGGEFVPRPVKVGDRNEVAVVVRSGLARRDVVAMVDPTRQALPAAKERE